MNEALQPTDAQDFEAIARQYMISLERYVRMRDVARRRQMDLGLILENIHDPHNVSAIIRSADAVGVMAIHFLYTREQFPRLNRAVSKGSQRWINFHYWTQPEQLFTSLRGQGYRIYATTLHPEARSLYSLDLVQPSLIIVGNEHRGVSEEAQSMADERIFIPMMGMAQSLNVSVATAISLYEAMRQRREVGLYDRPELTSEQQALLEYWLERELGRHTRRNKVGKYIPT